MQEKNPKFGNEKCFIRIAKRDGEVGGDPDSIHDFLSLPQTVEVTESTNYYIYILVINDTPGTTAEDVRVMVDMGDSKFTKLSKKNDFGHNHFIKRPVFEVGRSDSFRVGSKSHP